MSIFTEELVNTYKLGEQSQPQVAVLADGSYVVVWQSYGQDVSNSYSIHAQRFSASGVPVGGEFQISPDGVGGQTEPRIAALSDGGFVVAWGDSSGLDGSSQGILARAYDTDGQPRGDAAVVNSHTSSTQYQPAIAAYDGGYAVVWSSWGNTGGSSYDIYLQRHANDGSAIGGETLVSTAPGAATAQGGSQYVPDVATLADGRLVVVWNDSGSNDGSGDGVFGRLFDPATAAFGDSFLINTTTSGGQSNGSADAAPRVAALADGGFVAVWPANGQDGSGWGVYGQRFAADGSKAGGEFLINQSTNGSQYQAELTALSTGGFVVAWYNDNYDVSGSGTTSDVYVREYAADGTPAGDQRKLLSPTNNTEYQPAIADLGNGNYIVVYADYDTSAAGGNNTYEIRQQIFGNPDDFPRQANPELGDFSGTVSFAENLVNAAPQVIDAAVSFHDPDSADFDGGVVELFYTQYGEATDQLGVRNQGSAPGQIGVSGSTVSYGGVAIGTLGGGNDGSNLSITLNANADAAAVEALIENLTYASTSQSPAASRTVGIRVSDGDGGTSAASQVTINVALELDGVPEVHAAERVNTHTSGAQEDPQVATLADGGYVVVWQSNGQDGNSWGIYGQRFDAQGVAVGAEFRVNAETNGQQDYPQIAALSTGGFVVTWQDSSGADGSGWGVLGQRYDAAGTAAGDNFVVNSHTNSTQYHSAVAAYDGGYAVVWTSSGNAGGNSADIYVQRYANDGSAVGGETRVSTTPGAATAQGGAQYVPAIAAQTNGNLVIVWNDSSGADGSSDGVYARLFDAATQSFGDSFLVNSHTAGQQSNASEHYGPEVAMLADGGFVVVWPSSGQDGSGWGVYGQRFDAAGNTLGGEFRVNESTSSSQYQAEITALSTGGFVVAWHNDGYGVSGSGSTQDVYIREYGAAGVPLDGERKLTGPSSTASNQVYHPAIADLGDGNFVVAYSAYLPTASGGNNTYEIFQNLFGDAATLARGSAAPVLSDVSASVIYTEAAAKGAPQLIDPAVSLFDADSANFDGGRVDVFYTQYGEATDQLGVRHQGSAPGQIGVSGSTVSYGGVAIGTLGGGTDGSNLSILLNANADAAAVEALVENLTYASTTDNPGTTRSIGIRVADGDGGVSAAATVAINVQLDLAPAVSVHGEETVNSYRAGNQEDPQVATLADGGYVVVWQSNGQDGNSWGIYGQRFDAQGVAVGAEFRVNAETASQQSYPQIAALSTGGFVVTWQDSSGADGSGWGVLGQRYDATGNAADGNFVVNSHTSSTQYHSAVAAYDGGYAVVWTSSGNAGGNSADIYVQRYANDGSAVGGETRVSTTPGAATAQGGAQYVPAIAAQANGNLVIAWNDSGSNDGSSHGVYARLFDAATQTFGDSFLVNTYTAGQQSSSDEHNGPEVAVLADGGFVVIWSSSGQDGSGWGVYGQRFDAAGNTLGGEFRVNESTNGSQYQAELTALSTGGFVVAWHNDNYDISGSGTTQDVYIRQYDASGAPVDGERKLASPSNSTEQHPAIADLGNGNFIVVYNDYDTTASGGNNTYVIKQQIFGDPADFIRGSAGPVIDDVRALRTFTNNASDPYYSGNAQVIDADVGVYDIDSADFAGGQLVVQLLNGAAAAEALGVRDQGTGAAQIGVSGTTVSYGGVAIGSLSGGGAGVDTLVVSLNANADAAAVRALIENITYQHTAPASGSSDRYVGFRLSDGDGGVSSVANVQIRIQNSFSPAVLTLDDVEASLAVTESQAQAGVLVDDAVALDYTGAVGFDGGKLTVAYQGSTGRVDDQLSIRNQGSGTSQVGFSGAEVSYEGTVIGTLSASLNGANGAGLEITFNAAATDQAIERVIENLIYRNTSDGPNPSRTIRLDVRDANNVSGGTRDVVIDIAAEADPDAAVPLFGEQQSNSYEAGNQQSPAVARLFGANDGGYVVAWVSDGGQDGEGAGIFAQRYAADGSAVGPEFQVNSHTLGSQTEPAVAGLAGGGFVLTWTDQSGQDGSGYGVYAQRFGTDGTPQGDEFRVNTSTTSSQHEPAVLGLADGSFVIAYRSDYSHSGSSYSYDVLGQRYAADGSALGGEFVLNTLVSGTQYQPQLAALDGGGFVAIWTDSSGDSSGYGIVAQRFAADGSKAGGEIKVNTTETGTQQGPDVAGLAGGGFVATWHYNNNVYAQRFDTTGAKAGPEILVTTADTASNYSSYARVATLDDGGFVIAWDSVYGLGGSSYDVLAQQFDAAGNKVDGARLVNTVTTSWQYQPDIAALGDGKFVVAWAGYNQEQGGTASTYGVFHQLFGEAGAITRSAAPELLDLATSITFAENLVNAAPQIIDPGVRLIDADSTDFDGGTLWVSIVSGYGNITYAQLPEDVRAQDQLGIRHQGSAPGQIGISGNSVSYGGTVIGTLLGSGADGTDLVIRFNAAATPAAVEKLIENLTYANTSSAPVASRSISISVNDGDGGTSVPKVVTINVTPETDGAQPLFANERVNTYEPGTQEAAAIARLADGGYVVVWTSAGQDGWGDGVHGQRYDAQGVPVGSEFQVNSYTPNGQSAAAAAGLADGGYVVLWQSNGQDGSSWGIYGQRYDADGVPAGGEFQVNTHAQNEQSDVDVAALPGGGFVATWYSYYQDGTYQDVYFQRFGADGSTLGAETRANTSTGYDNAFQGTPAITAFADGSFVIVWRGDGGQDGEVYGIFGQRFAADGSALGAEFQVNSHAAGYQYEPDVTTLADGGFVVVWRSDGQDGSSAGVFGQRYDAAGNTVGDEFRVNTDTSGSQYQPSVSALSHGGFVVAWNDNSRTFAQQFDADGTRLDHPLRADTLDNNSTASLPAVLGLDDGAFVTVWGDYDYGTGSYNIHQQLFGSPGDFEHSANPELVDVATRVTFRENLVNAAPQLIDPAVGLFDADSADFNGGILEVNYITGYGAQDQLGLQGLTHQDQLGIRNQGSGTHEVGVSGTTVSFQGTAIGTIVSDGQNGAKLTVLFNANATSEAVERVIENLTYANTVSNPIASRTISIRVTDGDGGASAARTVQIDVIPEVDGAVPFGPEKVVNTTVGNEQSNPSVAVLDDGGYVVVWQSYSQDATSNWGVYGQRYDVDDNPVGGEFRINTTTAGSQYEAQVVGLAGGGFVVVWRSDNQDGSGAGVYGQRYAADGAAVGGEFRINTTTASNQYQPSVAADASGGFVVAWYHDGYSAGNTEYADIFFQRYAADGSALGGETRANPSLGSTFLYQSQPDITWLAGGGFAVVWTDSSGTDGNGYGVFGQVFDAAGNAVGNAFQVNSYITGTQQNPAIAALKDGGFVVAWESEGQDLSSTGVYAQRFDAAGGKVGAEFRVNTTISSTQYQPDVVGLENGGWVVTWTDAYGAASGYDVFVQQYDAAGRAVDGETRVNSYTPSTQYEPAIVATADGGFIVAYTGYTYSGDGNGDGVPDGGSDSYDIRLQRFSNTAPEITDVNVSGLEEAVIVLDYALFEANFSDADGQTLQAIRIVTLPANGSLKLDGVAVTPGQEIGLDLLQAGLLTYQGNVDFFGLDQFRWTGSDGIAFAANPVWTHITLANVNDGPRLEAGADDTALEGHWFSHTISIGDPDPEGHRITVNWGDGSPDTVFSTSSASPSISHYFADDGIYTVTVTVDDQQGQPNSIETDSFTVTVANVAPTIALYGNNSVVQGEAYTLDLGTPYDPGEDTVTEYRIDWGDGSDPQVIAAADLPPGGILTHTYATTGSKTISVTLVDEDGVHADAGSKIISVAAPAEVITVNAGSDIAVLEGSYFQKTISFDDPTDQGSPGRSYTVDWGDGQTSSGFVAAGQTSFVIGHTYADDAAGYAVTVTVDDDGQQGSDNFTVQVNNAAPTITLGGSASVAEGSAYALTLNTPNDPGDDTVQQYVIRWGDGSEQTIAAADLPADRIVTHVYADGNASHTIQVDLVDEDGTWVNAGSLSVQVYNVAPTIALSGADSVDEGGSYTLQLGAITDPGQDTVTQYQINWGDGTLETFTAAEIAAQAARTHVYQDGGTGGTDYTIFITLVDEDGTHTNAGNKVVTVNNVAPVLTVSGADDIDEGGTYVLSIGATDPAGAADPLAYTIDWGDGSPLQTLTAADLAALGGQVEHVYADDEDGPVNATARSITVTAEDGDGGTTTRTQAVTVHNVAPAIAVSGAASQVQGTAYALTLGAVTDPGTDAVSSYIVDWGDGNTSTYASAGAVTHTYASTGDFVIKVSLVDEDGTHADVATQAVEITAPSATLSFEAGADATLDEGGTFTRSIVFSDGEDNGAAGWRYTIDYGDGTVETGTTLVQSLELSHLYADGDATRTVTVTLTDEAGETVSDSFDVTVNNVAPTLVLTGDDSVDEGSVYVLNFGALVDPGTDTVTAYTLDWGDGTVQTLTAAEFTALGGSTSHVYADDGSYAISLTVTDEDGSFVAGSKSLTVANVAPTLGIAGDDDIDEGGTYVLSIAATDPAGAADPLAYTIDWGDGSPLQTLTAADLASLGGNVGHVYADDEDGPVNTTARTITVTADDGDGGVTQQSRSVTVHNVAPTPALAGAASQVQGTAYALTLGAVTDPGTDTVTSYIVDWGDGTVGVFGSAGEVTHTYSGTGNFVIKVSLVDEDGTHADVATQAVEITAPSATLSFEAGADATLDEGGTFTRSIVFSDGEDNGAAGWRYTIDYGDGTVETGTTLVQSLELSHLYADGDAIRTVTVTLTDEAGETVSDSFEVTVNNVAPTLSIAGGDDIDEGGTYVLSIAATDPAGAADPLAYTIDWGDGSPLQTLTAAELATLGGNVGHVYADDEDGPVNATARSITVTVEDGDGGSHSQTRVVTVHNVAPTLALTGADSIDEGSAYALNFGTLADPGTDTVTAYTLDWGDGTVQTLTAAEFAALGGSASHVYADDGSYAVTLTVTDEDGSFVAGSRAVTVNDVATQPPEVVRIGDAPTRVSSANPNAIADAWLADKVAAILHKADATDTAEDWSAVSFSGVNATTLAGVDHYSGDLGVSGQSAATSSVRQEIDGKEVLRIELEQAASKVTVDLSRFYLSDDGTVHAESGRLRLLDAGGNVVGETTFVADSATGNRTVILDSEVDFTAIELSAGAYDGTDFVFGAYADAAGDFSTGIHADGAGQLHGSDFLVDWVEFEFQPVGTPQPDPFGGL